MNIFDDLKTTSPSTKTGEQNTLASHSINRTNQEIEPAHKITPLGLCTMVYTYSTQKDSKSLF